MLSARDYFPLEINARLKSLAYKAWSVGLVAALIWTLAIIAAPLLRAAGITGVSEPLYTFYSFICHQLPIRSFHAAGEPFGVCSRCFGVYFGLLFGFAVYPLWRRIDDVEPIQRFWLFLSLIPIGVDWSLTMFGIWENNHASRFLTGLLLGAVCATFLVPALVEVFRNISSIKISSQTSDQNFR